MASRARVERVGTALLCTTLLAVGCGGRDAGSGRFPVTSQVVSDATTQDIHVFAPHAKAHGRRSWRCTGSEDQART